MWAYLSYNKNTGFGFKTNGQYSTSMLIVENYRHRVEMLSCHYSLFVSNIVKDILIQCSKKQKYCEAIHIYWPSPCKQSLFYGSLLANNLFISRQWTTRTCRLSINFESLAHMNPFILVRRFLLNNQRRKKSRWPTGLTYCVSSRGLYIRTQALWDFL